MTEFANAFLDEWQQLLTEHRGNDAVSEWVTPAAVALQRLIETTAWIQEKAQSDEATLRGAASQYLRLFALTFIACLWAQIIVSISDKSGSFYDQKRKLARFYMQQVLPETVSLATTITEGAEALADFGVSDLTS